jgi:phage tail sheath protein FI
MPTNETPDVYVEEISTFPISVAEVKTAIPAYFSKATGTLSELATHLVTMF